MAKKDECPKERIAFAKRLSLEREKHFDSKAAFARHIGVEAETYRAWERAENEPGIVNLIVLAKKLNVSLDYLILGDSPTLTNVTTLRRKRA